ncbi:hypothetical protein HPB47_005927, partial [Ixodes persulcatus]
CPSQDPTHPDYVPSIFAFKAQTHVSKKIARHGRLQERVKRQNEAQSRDDAAAAKGLEHSHEELPCTEDAATADAGANTEMTGGQVEALLQENDSLKKQTFLEPEEQLVMVLMRLRLGLLTEDLACRFRIPASSVSVIFHRWLDVL